MRSTAHEEASNNGGSSVEVSPKLRLDQPRHHLSPCAPALHEDRASVEGPHRACAPPIEQAEQGLEKWAVEPGRPRRLVRIPGVALVRRDQQHRYIAVEQPLLVALLPERAGVRIKRLSARCAGGVVARHVAGEASRQYLLRWRPG